MAARAVVITQVSFWVRDSHMALGRLSNDTELIFVYRYHTPTGYSAAITLEIDWLQAFKLAMWRSKCRDRDRPPFWKCPECSGRRRKTWQRQCSLAGPVFSELMQILWRRRPRSPTTPNAPRWPSWPAGSATAVTTARASRCLTTSATRCWSRQPG